MMAQKSKAVAPPLNAEMNVTPFVDVMLVLLIIFMIAAPLATVSIAVNLPSATAAPQAKPDEPLYVSLQKDGAIFVGDDSVTLGDLAAHLNAAVAARQRSAAEERLYLRADQSIEYKQIMQVMNALQDAGYTKIGLVAEETDQSH